MGFTKLDERILQSSIMAESPTTFKVWIALLAACRENGIAYVSAVYLSSICHLPIGKVEDAIGRLESPDEHSRSLADEGRRIRRVDGGYEIINYIAYRDVSLKDAEAERKRLYRQRHKECPDKMGHCPDASASASASASLEHKEGECEGKNIESEFNQFWDAYPWKEGKQDALKAFTSLRRSGVKLEDIAAGVNGYLDYLKHEKIKNGFNRRPKLPATLLRNDRWKEYAGFKYQPPL